MKSHSVAKIIGWGLLSFLLFSCEKDRDIIYLPYHEIEPGKAELGYKVVKITKFDMAVNGEYEGNYINFHLKISSTTKYKEKDVTEQVKETVFINKDFKKYILRVSIPESYAKFHIVISAPGYQTKTFDKTLQELKFYDNFHRSDGSPEQLWTVVLKRNNKLNK